MDDATVAAYLSRIGAARPTRPDAAALRHLQERHLMSIPFENINIMLGEPIQLGDRAVLKITRSRRGGVCHELNGSAFPALLRSLGYRVTLLCGRVFDGDRWGVVLGHVVLRVDAPEPWLVDVGFGRGSRYPLRLDVRDPQDDPLGRFQLVEREHGDLDLLRDGVPVYRLETRPRTFDELTPLAWWFQTSPESSMRQAMICSLVTPTGRVTIRGNLLTRTEHGRKTKELLDGDASVRAAYQNLFGITLDSCTRRME